MPEPLERLEAMYAEWARGDYSRSDLFDPAVTLEGFGMGERLQAEGIDDFAKQLGRWMSAWERPLVIEADELIQSGDRVLALVRWKGRGKGSGVEMEASGAHLWTLKAGRLARLEVYRDRDEARAALEQA